MIAALALLAAALTQSGDGQAGAVMGDAALGRWQTETRHGIVEITRCGSSICGHLETSDGIRADPQLRDVQNDDPALRSRLVKGLLILDGFHAKSGTWAGGWIYDASNGGTYHATVSMEDGTHLRVKGCIVWPLCQSQMWVRLR